MPAKRKAFHRPFFSPFAQCRNPFLGANRHEGTSTGTPNIIMALIYARNVQMRKFDGYESRGAFACSVLFFLEGSSLKMARRGEASGGGECILLSKSFPHC